MLSAQGVITKVETEPWTSKAGKTGTTTTVHLTDDNGWYERLEMGMALSLDQIQRFHDEGVHVVASVRFKQNYDEANKRMFTKLIMTSCRPGAYVVATVPLTEVA